MVHFNPDAVVVIYPRQSFEDVDVNGCQVRFATLIDDSVPLNYVLCPGMTASERPPGINYTHRADRRTSFSRVDDDVFHRLSALEDAAVQRVIVDNAGTHQVVRMATICSASVKLKT